MVQGEKLGAFGDEQWGSNTAVLLKHLTYETVQLTKTDGGTFDNAKACFERIIPALTQPPFRRASVSLPYACRIAAEDIMRRKDAGRHL
jgi:hypothetical protein